MVNCCSIPNCRNVSGRPVGIRFHRLSKYSNKIQDWIDICPATKDIENIRVCSQHFKDSDYKSGNRSSRLLNHAVPTYVHGIAITRTCEEPMNPLRAKVNMLEKQVSKLTNKLKSLQLQKKSLQQSKRRLEDIKLHRSTTLAIKTKSWTRQEKSCRQEMAKLILKYQKLNRFKVNTDKIFTPTQIRMIETGQSKANWTPRDIAKSLGLKVISTKAYDFIRSEWNFPLPCIRTLRSTLSQFDVSTGPIQSVFAMLKEYFSGKSTMDRQVIIAYDEMAISSEVCYFEREDRILGPHNHLQLVCIRGIFSNFKIPVYLNFDCAMTKEILDDLIERLHEAGLFPRGITFDLGGSNRGMLFQRLGITLEDPYYVHEKSNTKIWPFPDMAHLLKLLRNHFIDSGFTLPINDEESIYFNKSILQELIDKDSSELKSMFKLTQNHLMVQGQERQNVRKACEVFSESVAQGIRSFSTSPNKEKIADFFELVNTFWDVATARLDKHSTNKLKSAFGHPELIVEQTKIMDDFEIMINKLKMGRKGYALKPFQKGFLLFKNSHFGLWKEFRAEQFKPEYIITSNYGQCFLENIFGQIRAVGGFNMNPSPKECIYRIQGIMLSNLFRALKSSNTLNSDSPEEMAEHLISFLKSNPPEKGNYDSYEGSIIEPEPIISSENWSTFYQELSPEDKCEFGGKEHIAGFIAKKFADKFPDMKMTLTDQQRTPKSFDQEISRGHLTHPSYSWTNHFSSFDKEFVAYHSTLRDSDEYRHGKGVMSVLCSFLKDKYPSVPEEVVKFFVRTRTHIRIKHLNMIKNQKVLPTNHSLRSNGNVLQ